MDQGGTSLLTFIALPYETKKEGRENSVSLTNWLCQGVLSRASLDCSRRILSSHEADEVQDSVRVTSLVVVPGNKLDEVLVELDTGLGIKDTGVSASVELKEWVASQYKTWPKIGIPQS